MFAPYRITRLLMMALAACAATWAIGGVALAKPIVMRQPASLHHRPDFKAVVGDRAEPEHPYRPAFTAAPGDVKSDADRARAIAPPVTAVAVRATAPAAPAADDGTGTAALILSIAAILTALGAVTYIATRMPRGAARA